MVVFVCECVCGGVCGSVCGCGLGVPGGGREGPVGFLWEVGGVWSLKTRTPHLGCGEKYIENKSLYFREVSFSIPRIPLSMPKLPEIRPQDCRKSVGQGIRRQQSNKP